MNKVSGIYTITNINNKKVYVGRSIDIFHEWGSLHKGRLRRGIHTNKYLQSSWNKYGEDSFLHEIVEKCEADELNDKEKYYIKLFNSSNRNFGYNLTEGGEGVQGYKHSPESIKKISERTSGKNNPFYGRKHKQESIDKMSKYHTENPIPREAQIRAGKSRIGLKNGLNSIANRGSKKNKYPTSSSYVGCSFSKTRKKWVASICVRYKVIYGGSYDNEVDSAFAYDLLASYYFDEGASLNFNENREKYTKIIKKKNFKNKEEIIEFLKLS